MFVSKVDFRKAVLLFNFCTSDSKRSWVEFIAPFNLWFTAWVKNSTLDGFFPNRQIPLTVETPKQIFKYAQPVFELWAMLEPLYDAAFFPGWQIL